MTERNIYIYIYFLREFIVKIAFVNRSRQPSTKISIFYIMNHLFKLFYLVQTSLLIVPSEFRSEQRGGNVTSDNGLFSIRISFLFFR